MEILIIMYLLFILIGIIISNIINYYHLIFLNKKDRIKITVFGIFCIFLGSKIMDFIVNIRYYEEYEIVESIQNGYMFYGGIILYMAYMILFCKIKEIDLKKVLNVVIPNICLMYGIWKIGCYCNGCCSGKYSLPLQLIESTVCIILYLITSLYAKNNKLAIICIGFGIIRIIGFCIRDEIIFSNLLINEFISIVILIIGLVIYNRKE